MNKQYTIMRAIEGVPVPIGFFDTREHRDEAFSKYVQWGLKGEVKL